MIETISAAMLLAQTDGGGASPSMWELIVRGGVLMIPIGICSLVALTVIIERSVSLRRGNVIPAGFLSGLEAALGPGRQRIAAGLEYCRKNPSPIAAIVAAALRRLGEPRELLERHIEQAGEREILKLRKYLRMLSVIVAVAPMLGLLGTVFGMIEAFQTVASSGEALGRTEVLAKGIYEALVTTAAGLLVAIPAMVGYHWITSRIDRLVAEMDAMTVDLVESLLRRRGEPAAAAEPAARPATEENAGALPADAAVAAG